MNGIAGQRAQLVVEVHSHALATFREIQNAFVAGVTVLFKDHSLNAELNTLGVIGAARNVGTLAALVIHGSDRIALAFDQVEPRDQPETWCGEGDRACVDALGRFGAILAVRTRIVRGLCRVLRCVVRRGRIPAARFAASPFRGRGKSPDGRSTRRWA
jgi:hypothetical protein